MRITRFLAAIAVAGLLSAAGARLSLPPGMSSAVTVAAATSPNVTVGPQYDTTHVYVAPEDFDRFVASLVATLGGTTSKQGVFTLTPRPSSTMSRLVLTPAGTVSVFGFKTPIRLDFSVARESR